MLCLDDNAAAEFVSGALAASAVTKVEQHLAGCRDCRALVAALAGTGDVDSQAETRQVERITESQAGKLPKKLSVGDRVGRYLVLSTLGAGGMGVVFSAYDPQLDRKVALKVLRANLGANAKEARARLKREAQAIARLSHPNVVGVYEVGAMDDGDVYIAMEFVEGDNLTTWLKQWPRTWREIVDVFAQAGRGLAAAHSVGLLHRDFKPDNVLVGGDGRVRVTDFGLARSVLAPEEVAHARAEATPLHAELTATGTVLGTPRYMPPEQLAGPDVDARSDEFSFCVALYEALYGVHPLPDSTAVGMLEHGDEAKPPPEGARVPASIGRAVMRGLQKDRAKRFPSMAALLAELAPPPERPAVRYAIGGAVALVLAAGAAAAVMLRPDPKAPPPPAPVSDDKRVEQLLKRVEQLEAEKQHLIEVIANKNTDLQHVLAEVQEKDDQIHELLGEVTKLKTEPSRGTIARGSDPNGMGPQVVAAVATAEHDLEGCFDEWSSRQALESIEGWKPPAPKDAELAVELKVDPDGVAHDAVASGESEPRRDGSFVPVHGSLSICAEAALSRVKFPAGEQMLFVTAQVYWGTPGIVRTSARITGYREATKMPVDLE
ncbi:MAG TPA: serine/threonine-protein kinase [Kofleriaceae bacterium]|nr:serine/threonine-protein kinase [Kofleriaceae bacterium]